MAEFFGLIAILISIRAHMDKSPKRSLFLLSLGSLSWATHFIILGQIAFLILLLNAVRNYSSIYLDKHNLRILLAIILVISGAYTFSFAERIVDLVPFLSALSVAIAITNKSNIKYFRSFMFASEFNWLFYGILVSSYTFSLAAALTCTAIMIAILKDFHFEKPQLSTNQS